MRNNDMLTVRLNGSFYVGKSTKPIHMEKYVKCHIALIHMMSTTQTLVVDKLTLHVERSAIEVVRAGKHNENKSLLLLVLKDHHVDDIKRLMTWTKLNA